MTTKVHNTKCLQCLLKSAINFIVVDFLLTSTIFAHSCNAMYYLLLVLVRKNCVVLRLR